jgi:glycosyltransferase involved in cell wall biosynthesis
LGFRKADRKTMPHCNDPIAKHFFGFAQTLQGGGVERALLRLARAWLAKGRRVTLVLGSDEGPLAAEMPDGAELVTLGDPSYRALVRRLPWIVAARSPDIIFCPGNHYTAVAGAVRLRLGRRCPPIVAKVSNTLVRPEMGVGAAWRYRQWLRLHPLFLDHLVAMTPAMAGQAAREMGMPRKRISVIANPGALPVTGAFPLPLPAGRFVLGVGRLEPQKRWDRLIAAMPRLAAGDVALVILGEGSARTALEAQVRALGLEGRVTLPGYAADPLPALERASAAVLTSDFEGVPGVLREALGLGTPVVATDSSVAMREIITSPALGTVVPREDADALVAALDHWLAPDAVRPAPVVQHGDPAEDYVRLFDRLAAQRLR